MNIFFYKFWKTADYTVQVIVSFVADSFAVEEFVAALSVTSSFATFDISREIVDSLDSKIGSFVFEDFFRWRFSIRAKIDVWEIPPNQTRGCIRLSVLFSFISAVTFGEFPNRISRTEKKFNLFPKVFDRLRWVLF